jgi:hypothetical protein
MRTALERIIRHPDIVDRVCLDDLLVILSLVHVNSAGCPLQLRPGYELSTTLARPSIDTLQSRFSKLLPPTEMAAGAGTSLFPDFFSFWFFLFGASSVEKAPTRLRPGSPRNGVRSSVPSQIRDPQVHKLSRPSSPEDLIGVSAPLDQLLHSTVDPARE